MKTITVSVDDETYRLCRIKAAEAGTSISALVQADLVRLAQGRISENRFDRLCRLQDDSLKLIHARGAGLDSADNLARNALYERKGKGGQESPPSKRS